MTLLVNENAVGPCLVDIELAAVRGRIACVSYRIRTYAVDEEEQRRFPGVDLPQLNDAADVVTATSVRRHRVSHHIQTATQQLRAQSESARSDLQALPGSFDDWVDAFGFAEYTSGSESESKRRALEQQYHVEQVFFNEESDALQWVRDLRREKIGQSGKPRISDEELEQVAAIYQRARRSGDTAPSKAVARELNLKRERARRWVMYARRRGFLPPSPRSRAKVKGRTEASS